MEIDGCIISSQALNKCIPLIEKMNIINGSITIRCNQNEEILIIIESQDNLKIDIDSLKKK